MKEKLKEISKKIVISNISTLIHVFSMSSKKILKKIYKVINYSINITFKFYNYEKFN